MRVIPVLDLKNGVAVHAIKGQRDKYAPVACSWCHDGDVVKLIEGYRDGFGLHDLYVADLDAITMNNPNQDVYPRIAATVPGKVMIDAGITDVKKFNELQTSGFSETILGTESIPSLAIFKAIIKENSGTTIISFDVKNGQVLSPIAKLAKAGIPGAFEIIEALQPEAIIFLDLSGVGAKTGINTVAKDLARGASVPVYLGGGVKSTADLIDARAAGFKGVLLATALQEGLITPEELKGTFLDRV